MVRLLTGQKWDLVICTHFLPGAIVSNLRKRGVVRFPVVAAVTDFDVHGLWINRPCDRFFVATEEARANLTAAQGSKDTRNRAMAIEQIQHASDRPIVLQMAGGFGIESVERIHASILEIDLPLQVVVAAGANMRR